jgi:hypothetical protein
MTEGDKLQLIHPPNPLKMKVGIGGLRAVPPEVLARAEVVIANLSDDVPDVGRGRPDETSGGHGEA